MAQEVAKVGDRVLGVADQLALGLSAVQLFSLDVGQGGGDLAVSVFVGDDLGLAVLGHVSVAPQARGGRGAYPGGVGD